MAAVEESHPRIAVSDSGAGEPVLMIHCSSASGIEWANLSASLDDVFRPIAPDQWGCGDSEPWTEHTAFTLAEEATPILGIVDRIGTELHLLGHSYGGGVALQIARARPALIRSLALIEPSSFHLLRDGSPQDKVLFAEIAGVADSVRTAVLRGDYRRGMARFVDYWNGEGAWDAISQRGQCRMSERLVKVVLDFKALFEEATPLEAYAALPTPTLILCGESSPRPSRRIVEMLAGVMTNVRVQRIPGAGHMSPFTHPDAVNLRVRAHLQRHRALAMRAAA